MRFDSIAADLGWRYAFSRRSSLSLIGKVAICGLALSVAVLVVVVSVINGFERELERRVFAVLPHLSLHGRAPVPATAADIDRLESLPSVEAAVPFAQAAGLAVGAAKAQGMLLTGIVPRGYGRVSELARHVDTPDPRRVPGSLSGPGVAGEGAGVAHSENSGLTSLRPGAYRVILGARLAERIGAGMGDKVTLVLPSATVTPAGAFPRQKRFEIAGLLRTRSELDTRAAFVHLEDAQRFLRLGQRVHGYQVKLADFFAADAAARQSLALLGHDRFLARSWMRTHGNLHHAIVMQKTTMFVLLAFLVGMAAFNLVSTLVMTVQQRGADIAILKTMGAGAGPLMGGFVLFGVLIGGLGIAVGLAAGSAVAHALPALFAWISEAVAPNLMNRYFINYLPVQVRLADLAAIGGTAFALCVLGAAFPARRATRLLPRQVLAHE